MRSAGRHTGRLVAGALLIFVGVLFALDNFGVLRAGDLFQYWPLVLVGIGLTKTLQARYTEQRVGGLVLLAVGGIFLLRTFNLLWFRTRDLWPFLLLFVGAILVWQAARRRATDQSPAERALAGARAGLAAARGSPEKPSEAGAVLNEFAFMGGGDRVVRAQDFQGGEVTAIMGGFQIDLRGAGLAGDSATIEVFTLWGGVDFRVPEEWSVALHGVPILGVLTNSTHPAPSASPAKTLVVRGTAIMGGVEVKN